MVEILQLKGIINTTDSHEGREGDMVIEKKLEKTTTTAC